MSNPRKNQSDLPWLNDMMALKLSKKSVHDFLESIEEQCVSTNGENPGKNFNIKFKVPLLSEKISEPTLERFKFLTEIDFSPKIKELYDAALISVVTAKVNHEFGTDSTYQQLQGNKNTRDYFEKEKIALNESLGTTLSSNKDDYKVLSQIRNYRKLLSERVKTIKQDELNVPNMVSHFVNFGIELKATFPDKSAEEINAELKLYQNELADLPKTISNVSADLALKLCSDIYYEREPNFKNEDVVDFHLGIDGFDKLLKNVERTNDKLSVGKKNELNNMIKGFLKDSIIPVAAARVSFDNALAEITKYANEKAKGSLTKNKNENKSLVAKTLVTQLKVTVHHYLIGIKREKDKEEFLQIVKTSIDECSKMFGTKNTARWDRLIAKVNEAINAIAEAKVLLGTKPRGPEVSPKLSEVKGTLFDHEKKESAVNKPLENSPKFNK